MSICFGKSSHGHVVFLRLFSSGFLLTMAENWYVGRVTCRLMVGKAMGDLSPENDASNNCLYNWRECCQPKHVSSAYCRFCQPYCMNSCMNSIHGLDSGSRSRSCWGESFLELMIHQPPTAKALILVFTFATLFESSSGPDSGTSWYVSRLWALPRVLRVHVRLSPNHRSTSGLAGCTIYSGSASGRLLAVSPDSPRASASSGEAF